MNAPFVKPIYMTLGGKDKATIFISISLDDPGEWNNRIFENSRYIKLSFDRYGTLKMLTQHYGLSKKFRKGTVKSVEKAIDKINKWIKDVS